MVSPRSSFANTGMKRFGCVVTQEDYKQAVNAGYDYVEISGRNTCALDHSAFHQLLARFREGAIPCLGFNAYCPPEIIIAGPGFSRHKAAEYAKHCAERAVALGIQVVGVGSPFSRILPDDFGRDKAWEQAIAFFQATCQAFYGTGITICLEALGQCYCNFINSIVEAQKLVREAGEPNLKIVLDFYNMEHEGEADISLESLVGDIGHAHISDDAGTPQQRWFLKGEKATLHQSRIARLYEAGYRSLLTVEIDLPVQMAPAVNTLNILRDTFRDTNEPTRRVLP